MPCTLPTEITISQTTCDTSTVMTDDTEMLSEATHHETPTTQDNPQSRPAPALSATLMNDKPRKLGMKLRERRCNFFHWCQFTESDSGVQWSAITPAGSERIWKTVLKRVQHFFTLRSYSVIYGSVKHYRL